MKMLLVASAGGHLSQLIALRHLWEEHERRWVTFDQPDALTALDGEIVATAHSPTTRNLHNAVRNLRLAWSLIGAWGPDVIISTGAGVSVPFFVAARCRGIASVFVEVYDRITQPSLSGTVCYALADQFCVQWSEQTAFYPAAVLIGPTL